jgi:hypothetical protein
MSDTAMGAPVIPAMYKEGLEFIDSWHRLTNGEEPLAPTARFQGAHMLRAMLMEFGCGVHLGAHPPPRWRNLPNQRNADFVNAFTNRFGASIESKLKELSRFSTRFSYLMPGGGSLYLGYIPYGCRNTRRASFSTYAEALHYAGWFPEGIAQAFAWLTFIAVHSRRIRDDGDVTRCVRICGRPLAAEEESIFTPTRRGWFRARFGEYAFYQ